MAADEARVPAGPLIQAWNQLALENERVAGYYEAAEFWGRVGQFLKARRGLYAQHITGLEATGWTSGSSTALIERARKGVGSIDAWLAGDLPGTANKFRVAADTIGPKYQAVNEIRDLMSGTTAGFGQALSQAWDRVGASGGGEVPAYRMEGDVVVVTPAGHAPTAQRKIEEAAQHARDVDTALDPVRRSMETWQSHLWEGPLRGMAPGGPLRNLPAGPAGAPPGGPAGAPPGGPGGAPPGGPGGAPPGGPAGAPPGGPGGAPPGGPAGAPPGGPAGAPPDLGAPGSEVPGGDVPGAELPGGPELPELPPTDPSLAGMPTATLPTTTPPPVLPDFTPPSSLGSSPGSSTPTSFTPVSTPFTGSNPQARRDAADPQGTNPRGSTVDGSRAAAPGGGVGGGPQPVPRNTVAGGGSSSSGGGFFPPMMPPMMPPGGGMGAGGIKPGEAEFAGGPPRQVSGRDSLRAGLRSQLLGRTGEYDDEPSYPAPSPAGGEVLDEELWRVPDAAPVSPPDPQPRRGRSWGSG